MPSSTDQGITASEVYAIGEQNRRRADESLSISLAAVRRLAEKMGIDPRDILPAGMQ